DVLLTGLPEREALGLNVIEAQACGVPVLAPGAPPFTETVLPGETGWLYADPRQNDGKSGFPAFSTILQDILLNRAQGSMLDPRLAIKHMTLFSRDAFGKRLAELLASVT
ncbi:MAG: glycosyltransferase, partial [Azonexus sp.]|nr:glycosyltransferase [Azonexus sp.]